MIDTKQKADNTLSSLRAMLFDQMISLRAGDSSANDAIAVGKLSHQIIESYKVEIEAVKVANDLKDKNTEMLANIKAISNEL